MNPTLRNPPRFKLAGREGPRVQLSSEAGYGIDIFVLETDIIRVLHTRPAGLSSPRSFAIAPGAEDVADEGRNRFDASGFAHPRFDLAEEDDLITISTETLRLTIAPLGPFFHWAIKVGGAWIPIARDRPTQAYNFGYWTGGVRHYLARKDGERYFGLGEKSGALNLAGRRLRLSNLDAMGYDARTSDPLYKHIPFVITHNAQSGLAYGLFYDTYTDCAFDLGAEHSNYHGPYRSFTAESGDLDYYVIAGPTIAEAARRFTWLTGRPALMPRWAFGYSGSTMSYTDAPDAHAQMQTFIDACRRHDILCDSFHFSSGYTSIGARRYVFNWNRDKFPDPRAFVKSYHDAGLKLCANIKPCLLDDHPLFAEAHRKGLLICEDDGEPSWCQFWDGLGAYLDFTNPAAQAWWREHVTTDLLEFGVDATWNDNNEFEINSPSAKANYFGAPASASESKPLQTLLMQRTSRAAQKAHAPEERPYLVSRAGAAGMQRYVQTWSGDNSTSWDTLRFNSRMGLALALSGVSNSGHDIGGFAGERPDPELFVRWVEAGVFMPRFSIHSWKRDGSVNEPWMYPETTDVVRDLIKLRYQLLPYLYDLHWRNHSKYEPIVRPTFYDFPDDPACYEENDELMLGPSLLVASVMEAGAKTREVRLPAGADWCEFWTGARHKGGERVTVAAPLGQPPLFVRTGSAIPLNLSPQSFDQRGDERAFAIFAPEVGNFEATCHEDDGNSEAWRQGAFGAWRISGSASAGEIELDCAAEGLLPPTGPLSILVHASEERAVSVRSNAPRGALGLQGWRRVDF